MQKCKIHNIDYEDFCILCAAEEQKNPLIKWYIGIAVMVVLILMGLIYGLTLFSD
jgi:hypothetical protein